MPDLVSDTSLGKRVTSAIPEGYSLNKNTRLVRAGNEYFDLLEQLIANAKHSIHFQTYIFEYDETGKRIAKALMQAARRGIKVFMVVDGYASQELTKEHIVKLRESGIYFRFFNPILKSNHFYFGRRLHHKVVLVDGAKCLVGGINIGNHYNNTTENIAWLDWALYTEGPLGRDLVRICEVRIKRNLIKSLNRLVSPPIEIDATDKQLHLVRPRINDWVRRKKEITNSYVDMLKNAESRVIIISSYFLPGVELRKSLKAATKRGVNIKVILAGISDVSIAKNAERYMYRWLLRNNIEIYEYQRKILHAKLATYDGKWFTVGSYNVNNISAYASVELNLEVLDSNLAMDVEHRLDRIIQTDCIRITEEKYLQNQNLWNRYIQRSAYDIFRVLLFIFTFYFKQRD